MYTPEERRNWLDIWTADLSKYHTMSKQDADYPELLKLVYKVEAEIFPIITGFMFAPLWNTLTAASGQRIYKARSRATGKWDDIPHFIQQCDEFYLYHVRPMAHGNYVLSGAFEGEMK